MRAGQVARLMSCLLTMLYLPQPREDLVFRQRLVARIGSGLAGSLTLVSAPPGFGKTSLLAQALADRTVGWLSLDADDNDPPRFWAYVIAALQTAQPGTAQALLARLRARREMAELHAGDLRFTQDEASALVSSIAGQELRA